MEEFNLDDFAKMFDAALASNNPTVKKALRNLMIVAAIVHAETEDERSMGPLETLIKKVGDLERMVYELQNNRTIYPGTTRDYYKEIYGNNPTWIYQPTTSVSSTAGSWTSSTYSAQDISELLKDLRFNENKSD